MSYTPTDYSELAVVARDWSDTGDLTQGQIVLLWNLADAVESLQNALAIANYRYVNEVKAKLEKVEAERDELRQTADHAILSRDRLITELRLEMSRIEADAYRQGVEDTHYDYNQAEQS